MPLVVETGTSVAGANSFVSRAEIISYASARGIILPDDATTDILGMLAMDYLRSQCFKGVGVIADLPFPRSGLVLGDTAVGYVHSIPLAIKMAQLALVVAAKSGVDLVPNGGGGPLLKRSKVGPLEREFFAPGTGDADSGPPLTVASAYLAPFLCDTGLLTLKSIRV